MEIQEREKKKSQASEMKKKRKDWEAEKLQKIMVRSEEEKGIWEQSPPLESEVQNPLPVKVR